MNEYDRLGAKRFFTEHGFAPIATYELVCEGGKSGAVKVLGRMGFSVQQKQTRRSAK